MEEISDLLDGADPALSQKLARLDCAECYFAYRMVLVMMRRELPLSEVQLFTLRRDILRFEVHLILDWTGSGAMQRLPPIVTSVILKQ